MKTKRILLAIALSSLLFSCGGSEAASSSLSSAAQASSSAPEDSGVFVPSSVSDAPADSSDEASRPANSSLEDISSSPSSVSVSSVSLDKSSLTIYSDDADASLTATVWPENATNKAVTWSSSNREVATINNGKITPLHAGTTVITVKTMDGNKTATCALTVKEAVTIPNYVLHGTFNGSSEWSDKPMVINDKSTSEYMLQGVTLHQGDVFKVHMYGDTWYGYSAVKSSTPSGLVSAAPSDDNIKVLSTGVYDIYSNYSESDGGHIYLAKSGGQGGGGSSTVAVTDITLKNTGKFMEYRHEFVIEANIFPSNASNQQVTWTSSDTSIATVTKGGRVVAQSKRGSAIITAKTVDGNKTATCLVYVSPSAIPAFYLTGTVGGYSRSSGKYTFAAIPLATNKYVVPDVDLVLGDEVTITGSNGARLKDKYNKIYTLSVSKNMSVNIYFETTDGILTKLETKERGDISIPKS